MISGIVLAAGQSRRMGVPKALLPYKGKTFIDNICGVFLAGGVGELVVVVGGHQHEERIRAAVPKDPAIRVVTNHRYEMGQLSSLVVGLKTLSSASEAALVNLVDHPLVKIATVKAVVSSFRKKAHNPIIVACYKGRRGHPVLFAQSIYDELMNAPQNQGAKAVVRKTPSRVTEIALTDPGIRADIDTPGEFKKWVGPPDVG